MKPLNKPMVAPALGLLFAVITVSTSSIFIRFAQTGAPSLAIAAWRLSLASIILVPIAWIQKKEEIKRLDRKTIGLLILSGTFLCFHFASWISSLEYTSVASSVVLVTTSPLWVAILSPIVLHERLDKAVWIGLLVAITGSVIVGGSNACHLSAAGLDCSGFNNFLRGQALWGNFLALVGAWCVAGYLLIGRRVRTNISLLSYTGIVYGVAAVGLLMIAIGSGTRMTGFSPEIYLWLLLLAFVPQLLGHSTYNWALRYLSATYVSVGALGEPIASSFLAFVILKEAPTILEIVGGGLILLGIYLAAQAKPAKA